MKYKYNYNSSKPRRNNKSVVIALAIIIFVAIVSSLFLFKENKIISKINGVLIKPFKAISSMDMGGKISSIFETKKSLQKENSTLREENTNLSLKLLEYQKILRENESLRKMLEIESTFQHYNLAHGKIIIRSHDNYTKTFVIDVGSKDGIKVGQTVIHKEGLVGYISKVNEDTSTVLTILDPKTSVSAIIPTVNTPAILSGNLEMKQNNTLKLESIEIGSEISIGDIIYTSGLGQMYEPAIPIAKITKNESKKTDSERYAICEPLVNISEINEVSVIIGESDNDE